jgi:hypothetical protein
MEPTNVRIPKGLLLWPLMAFSARFVKKSTRRQVLERMKAERAVARPHASATEDVVAGN